MSWTRLNPAACTRVMLPFWLGAAAGSIEHLRGHALDVDQGLGKIRSLTQRNKVALGNRKLKRVPPNTKRLALA